MRTIKFSCMYTNGESWIDLRYTLEQMEIGEHLDAVSDIKSLEEFRLAHKRQFTGLKDKNGTEIYESDLIRNERGRIARVDFNKYCACFDAVFVSDDPKYYNPSKDRAYGFQSNMWGGHVEVIGNIYENPELLEEK